MLICHKNKNKNHNLSIFDELFFITFHFYCDLLYMLIDTKKQARHH